MSSIKHQFTHVNGVEIFYHEAGERGKPVLVLLHGHPTSSHMYRNLLHNLSGEYHLIAPDYPGFGRSEQPPMANFTYTFENFSLLIESFLEQLNITKFSLYLMDYGTHVGFRIAANNPQKIESLSFKMGVLMKKAWKLFGILLKPIGLTKLIWKQKKRWKAFIALMA